MIQDKSEWIMDDGDDDDDVKASFKIRCLFFLKSFSPFFSGLPCSVLGRPSTLPSLPTASRWTGCPWHTRWRRHCWSGCQLADAPGSSSSLPTEASWDVDIWRSDEKHWRSDSGSCSAQWQPDSQWHLGLWSLGSPWSCCQTDPDDQAFSICTASWGRHWSYCLPDGFLSSSSSCPANQESQRCSYHLMSRFPASGADQESVEGLKSYCWPSWVFLSSWNCQSRMEALSSCCWKDPKFLKLKRPCLNLQERFPISKTHKNTHLVKGQHSWIDKKRPQIFTLSGKAKAPVFVAVSRWWPKVPCLLPMTQNSGLKDLENLLELINHQPPCFDSFDWSIS